MILRKKKKQYQSPDEGSHLAVLADIENLGEKVTPWGQQHQLRFRWFVRQVGKDAKELSVIATYNNSLNENSSLVQVITDLTGAPPEDGFDTDTLIGINSWLTIKHNRKPDGSVFPKVGAMRPPAKGDPVLRIPAWYKRGAKPIGAPLSQQTDNPELPPEPDDIDAGDGGTSFPGGNATSNENAA
jgi:hypothetical protein